MLSMIKEHALAIMSESYPLWPGQSLRVARSNDEEQWTCQRATVAECRPDFVVLSFQAGYRECFDWHAYWTRGENFSGLIGRKGLNWF